MKPLPKTNNVRVSFLRKWALAAYRSIQQKLFGSKRSNDAGPSVSLTNYAIYLLVTLPVLMIILSVPGILDQLTSLVTLGFISCSYLLAKSSASASNNRAFQSLNFSSDDRKLLFKAFIPSLLAWIGTGLSDHWIWHSPPIFGAHTPVIAFACSVALYTPVIVNAALTGTHYAKQSGAHSSFLAMLRLRKSNIPKKPDETYLAIPVSVAAVPWILRLLPLHGASIMLRFVIKSVAIASGVRTLTNIPKLAPQAAKLPLCKNFKSTLNRATGNIHSVVSPIGRLVGLSST